MKLSGKKLTRDIIIGMAVGIAVGLIINFMGNTGWVQEQLTDGLFNALGQIFIRLLKMLIVPLVFVSLVCGTSSLADPRRLGRLGGKALLLYLGTTALAVTSALVFASLFQPGKGSGFEAAEFDGVDAPPSLWQVLTNMVPANPVQAMAETEMLQLIVFSILVGLALTFAGETGKRMKQWFEDANEIVMIIVAMVMKIAPYGVFALLAKIVAELGWSSFALLLDYFLLVLVVLVLHCVVTYPILLKAFTGLSPLTFLRKMRPPMVFAFSTASSNATLPVTLRTVETRLGVDNSVASFTIPLGATINMDGTAIMQGIATVFIANVYGIDLSLGQLMTVVVMATLASVGAAGVPGVGLILLAAVLAQVGLPAEGIGLILGIDRLLDMTRTVVNITGDATITSIIARSEGDLDETVFNDPDAGERDIDSDQPTQPATGTG